MKRFWGILATVLVIAGLMTIPVQAATYNDYVSGGTNQALGQSAYDPGTGSRLMFFQARTFDLNSSKFSASGVTQNDVLPLFDVPKNTYILGFGFRNLRGLGSVSGVSAEVGDGADIDGYVGNDYTSNGVPFIDLTAANSGASVWQFTGPLGLASGASVASSDTNITFVGNQGVYFKTGLSPYVGPDTIDMKFYVNKQKVAVTGATPYFEAWVWGFHVPTP